MAENDSDFGVFLAGFIVGGLVGAATALLMAPKSGVETRTYIKEKSIELKDEALKSTEEARLKAESALADARVKAETAAADAKVKADEFAQQAKVKADELAQKAKVQTGELRKRGQVILDEQKGKVGKVVESAKTRRKAASKQAAEASVSDVPVVEEIPLEPPAESEA
jgi:gas vesicle protein